MTTEQFNLVQGRTRIMDAQTAISYALQTFNLTKVWSAHNSARAAALQAINSLTSVLRDLDDIIDIDDAK